MKQIISTLVILSVLTTVNYAQSVVNSSGASISNANLIVEYSIGEIVITTIQGGQNAATQGLLQPTYEIISAVNEEFDRSFSFTAFPNPTANQLNIETDYPSFKTVQIFNIVGQIVAEQLFDGNPILLSGLPSGTYLFSFQSEQFIKTVKIIKK
jgi:hypothetical protein